MATHPSLSPVIGLPLAIAVGIAIPLQGRINGALGTRLDDSLAAAPVSFGTGLVLMIVISLTVPTARAGARQVVPAVREGAFRRTTSEPAPSARSSCSPSP
ncbi:uncharacterized membrane protein YdcZ (DUF606 family) [Arthrobacter sp. CAN_A214]